MKQVKVIFSDVSLGDAENQLNGYLAGFDFRQIFSVELTVTVNTLAAKTQYYFTVIRLQN